MIDMRFVEASFGSSEFLGIDEIVVSSIGL